MAGTAKFGKIITSTNREIDTEDLEDYVDANPIGTVLALAGSTLPNGYLECNGAEIGRVAYSSLFAIIGTTYGVGNNADTFNLPDLRGEFIRGYDGGRGIDSGRVLGSWQVDDIGSHNHRQRIYQVTANAGYYPVGFGTVGGNTWTNSHMEASGGTETRPRNIAMKFCIKY